MGTGHGGCAQFDRGHAACTIAAISIIEKCVYSVNTLYAAGLRKHAPSAGAAVVHRRPMRPSAVSRGFETVF